MLQAFVLQATSEGLGEGLLMLASNQRSHEVSFDSFLSKIALYEVWVLRLVDSKLNDEIMQL